MDFSPLRRRRTMKETFPVKNFVLKKNFLSAFFHRTYLEYCLRRDLLTPFAFHHDNFFSDDERRVPLFEEDLTSHKIVDSVGMASHLGKRKMQKNS